MENQVKIGWASWSIVLGERKKAILNQLTFELGVSDATLGDCSYLDVLAFDTRSDDVLVSNGNQKFWIVQLSWEQGKEISKGPSSIVRVPKMIARCCLDNIYDV